MREVILVSAQSELGEPKLRCCPPLRSRDVQHFKSKLDIGDRRAPGQQPVALKHDRHLAAERIELGKGIASIDAHGPLVGSVRPATMLKIVDLPQPVLPSSASIWPGRTSRLRLSTARNRPDGSHLAEHLGNTIKVNCRLPGWRCSSHIARSDTAR